MKKIGILTFQNADNYGALLQAYALKNVLSSLGGNPEILNYCCSKIEGEYRFFTRPQLSFKWLFLKTIKLLFLPLFLYRKSRFSDFRKQYLTDTATLYPETIAKIAAQYDAFVSGSDQVFNPRITGFDRNYFLAFNKENSKNYSYAASFGVELKDLSEKEKTFIQQNVGHLKYLSVREQQGAEIIRSIHGRTAQVHLDPTLLLDLNQWRSLAVSPKYTKYVLLYLMHKDPQLISFAKKLAQAKGCQLLYICSSMDIKNRVPVKHITPTPKEWLGLFLNAQYVVTNSFHGLAFSVNFNRDFFLGKLPPSWPTNSRLNNLLSLTGLQSRIYDNFIDNYDESIDWMDVNARIGRERQKAFAYLQEIIK